MSTTSSNTGILKRLLLIHKAMLVGQLILALVAFYLVYTNSFTQSFQHLNRILQSIAIASSIAGIYAGTYFFNKKLAVVRTLHSDVKEKLFAYQQACILQWALLEGPCIFVSICFLLTSNYAFLALTAVLVLLFTMMAPSKLKIGLLLQIGEEEINEC